MRRRLRRILLVVLASLLGLVLLALLTGTALLRGSLARLDGTVSLAGLEQSVTITRDDLGVPDIQAASRLDAARALGYLHGQDRFFQMDLQRRNAAGELAALLGPGLVAVDRDNRRHRFRMRAEAVLAAANPTGRAHLDAYTDGVNAGLADLKVRPFEYLVLRQQPEPWRPADTVLTLYAMFLDLSLSTAWTEETYGLLKDNLPAALVELLLPRSNRWEAPLEDGPVPGVQLPDSTSLDLRRWSYSGLTYDEYHDSLRQPPQQDTAGSNNWAVAGSLTGHGGALLANDMHLSHGLPNIWYRARMSWPEGDGTRSVVGVTLPGAPALVAGSNGQVAWGFTNSYGDWVDLVILTTDSADSTRYRTPAGWRSLNRVPEVITVAGAAPDTLWIDETIWGPVWLTDSQGRRLVLRWTAHDTDAVNVYLDRLETVGNVEEAVQVAATIGMPQQNFVCADSGGHIGWTIAGRIPRRVGWDGRFPESWADGSHRWDGYLEPSEQPRIVDPPGGRLWTANNRVVAGHDLAVIGDGGYGLGPRARQIRDDLRALDKPVEKDMLAVQLDDRAVFRAQWRKLVLGVLAAARPAAESPRGQFQRVVRDQWSGRAEPGSVAYRLVRGFSFECSDLVYEILIKSLYAKDPDFQPRWLPHRLAVSWEVLAAEPANLLPPMYDDWDDLVLVAVDRVMAWALAEGRSLDDFTWGARNQVVVGHPFTQMAPWLSRWLAAPVQPMPGDSFMPRVQHQRSGASERMVVSPGREADGLFEMPGGQSGHPLSPYFLAGHEDWVAGRAAPLLPGAAVHRLVLAPARSTPDGRKSAQ